MGPGERSTPFVIRLAAGDIAEARATMLVVNHFNGVPPAGAERAIDVALGGTISRRAARGALDGHFGGSHFFPTATVPLAASAVLVIGLGEAEKFTPERLPEVGAAVVEAAAALSIRDVATILHGGGSAGVEREEAARLFVEGLLDALGEVPGSECFRELTIVEIDPTRLPEIALGVKAAKGPPRVHVYIEPSTILPTRPPPPAPPATDLVPEHLRVGITRAGPDLKVTVIGHGSYDTASTIEYPAELATGLIRNLERQVLREPDPSARVEALRSIGHQLYEAFIGWTPFDVPALVAENRSRYVLLRLDRWTVDLPWEILFRDGYYACRLRVLGRQLEVYAPGRAATRPPAGDTLNVLVVGNPTGDLPASEQEARAVVQKLESLRGARVKALIGDVAYADVSAALDTTRYDVLHYAGHAEFGPGRESVGGLVLKDAMLTAEDLSTRRFLPRLFFANACNSADTRDDGDDNVFAGAQPTRDLVSGLLRMGVRAFIGSMWRVNDAAAETFACAFYDALLRPDDQAPERRTPVGKAVCNAREAVIEAHGEGQPAWAAYALYGSPWTPGL
jgi:hypothetical protein